MFMIMRCEPADLRGALLLLPFARPAGLRTPEATAYPPPLIADGQLRRSDVTQHWTET